MLKVKDQVEAAKAEGVRNGREVIAEYIRQHEEMSHAEIAAKLGYSHGFIARVSSDFKLNRPRGRRKSKV